MDQRKPCRCHRQQHCVACILSRLKSERVDRFERQTFDPDDLQRKSVAGDYRIVVDLRRIGQMIADRSFAARQFFTRGKH